MKMVLPDARKAISAALNSDWEKAVNLNLKILENFPEDIETLNRLAKAYFELGNTKKAIATSKKVLSLDPLNKIAPKNIEKWKSLNGNIATSERQTHSYFIEEPRKTKTVPLTHLGNQKTIAALSPGIKTQITAFKHRVCINTPNGNYVGRLPDDIAHKIINGLRQKNEYEILIRSVSPKQIKVFITETKTVSKNPHPL